MKLWEQILVVFIGIPVGFIALYLIARIVSVAFLHSWWDTKIWYLKKLNKEQEEKNGNR